MPYQGSERQSAERTSRLGHLQVVESDLVKKLVRSFEDRGSTNIHNVSRWQKIPSGAKPLRDIFSVDGSMQPIVSDNKPYKRLAYVKTALLRINLSALSEIDKDLPHPFALKNLLSDSALYHSTVFPLQNVSIPGMKNYHAIRQIIFDSIKDPSPELNEQPMETLKWLAYQKWDRSRKNLPLFECPHCEEMVATLPYDAETGQCPNPSCKGDLLLTDMLGFHQVMAQESAPDSVATDYMTIHETLLLFTGIRIFWEHRRDFLSHCLFIKDGPLSIRAQYSKLVNPIRSFLRYARDIGYPIFVIGQEKSGRFYDHMQLIGEQATDNHFFIPNDRYVKEEIQQRPDTGAPYGKDTNYGAKVFVKINNYDKMVLNIPTGEYVKDPDLSNLIGADRIFSTLPTIMSARYEGALLPIELVHGIASMATYPSAEILKLFTEKKGTLES